MSEHDPSARQHARANPHSLEAPEAPIPPQDSAAESPAKLFSPVSEQRRKRMRRMKNEH